MLTFLATLKKSVEALCHMVEKAEHRVHAKMILEDIDQATRAVEAAISTPKIETTVNTKVVSETKTDSSLQEAQS